MLYFGYCTLLETANMKRYCPTAVPEGVGSLAGYKLCFETYGPDDQRGGCNLKVAEGEETLGVLYELTPEELAGLDKISGVRFCPTTPLTPERLVISGAILLSGNCIQPDSPSLGFYADYFYLCFISFRKFFVVYFRNMEQSFNSFLELHKCPERSGFCYLSF